MRFKTISILSLVLILWPFGGAQAEETDGSFLFSKDSRVLVIAPHPDDETLGAGGVIQSVLEAGGDVKVVYLTHGDYNEIASLFFQKKPLLSKNDFIKSGQIRSKEAMNAMRTLGLGQKNLVFLGYPDFGTLSIWRKHWGEAKPYRSFMTRINKVPYKEDFSFGRPYRGENIVNDIEKILLLYRPTHIFVTAPFDLNTDHKAAYLYLQVALLNLQNKIDSPKVFAYLIHAHRWPIPRKFKPEEILTPPLRIQDDENLKWKSLKLKPEQVELKRQALLKYESQIAYSKNFMLSFVRTNELFLELFYHNLAVDPAGSVRDQKNNEKESGANQVNYWIKDEELWIDIQVTNPLDELGTLSMEVFSYKTGTDFLRMPKLNLVLLGGRVWARDGYKRLPDAGIHYELKKRSLKVRIPIKLLKEPEFIFVSTRTIKDDISLDFGAWQILKLPHR